MEVTQRRPVGNNVGKWSSTRRGTLTIALIATLIAAAILAFALHRYRQSVETSGKPATVLVAKRFIPKGSSGAAIGVGQYFRTTKVREKQVSAGALTNTAALHGRVAATDIYPGQQLTAADFVSGGLFYSKLPPNQRAISVPLDTSHGLIGDVKTGDRVDVYVSFQHGGGQGAPFLRLLARNIVVLDAGQLPGSGGLGATNVTTQTANVALEVGIHQAAELAFAADNGKIWLILRPANGTSPTNEVVNEHSIAVDNPQVSRGGTK
jgi:Flp pilus assembly protein CpaB